MTLEQLSFCLYTVNKGDDLYVAYEENFLRKEYTKLKIVTRQDISHIVELLIVPKKENKYPYGFFTYGDNDEQNPVLLRKHRNKYYDIHGNRVTVW